MFTQEDFLNEPQRVAVTHREGPLLVLAGAGSGKTRVVAYRIAHLIAAAVAPSQILAITFTNKAAGEMQERVALVLEQRFQSLNERPLISTFHSLGARILRESIHHLGYSPHFTIYDEEDTNKLLQGCLETLHLDKKDPTRASYRQRLSHAKNQLLTSEQLALEQPDLAPVYSLYQLRLREAQAVDFDDLLLLPVELFRQHPDLLATYQARWRYLLIDEYQDTNYAQSQLVALLVKEHHNLFVVGDPDQSIYSWRGADIQNILTFEEHYPKARVVRLDQNYRSRSNILEAANALIHVNQTRYEKQLWSQRGEGEPIKLFIGESDREETAFVAAEIERLHLFHQLSYSQIIIFYRTNFQSRIFEDVLLSKRIPYVIVGGISFYHRREIKDLLAFLRMLCSDTDLVAFERTINLPKRGLGETTLQKIKQGCQREGKALLPYCLQLTEDGESGESLRLTCRQKAGLKEYVSLLLCLRALKESVPLHLLIKETVRQSGYLELLREEKETFEDRRANIEELVSKAYAWVESLPETTAHPLESFLEELSLRSSIDEASFSQEKVNLMTIHNGKGLESDTVFLVGMEEPLFPHINARSQHNAMEEERRLCYVGMTRAKERLYLTAAKQRFIWGGLHIMQPSRFLREIPKHFLQRLH